MTIPGIGPIAATAITALVPAPEGFRVGRDFAAWLGLTPLQKSTGGKHTAGHTVHPLPPLRRPWSLPAVARPAKRVAWRET